MSIDKNVGGMSRYLSGIIRNSTVNKVKDEVEKILQVSPGGTMISKTANKMKDSIISKFTPQEASTIQIGGTSLIIIIGVAIETFRQIETASETKEYKGFLD